MQTLTPDVPAPAKPVILTNTKNKIQLNAMLVEGLLNSDYYTNATQKHTLTIAGVSDVPVEGLTGMISVPYMRRLISHTISCSLSGKYLCVVCDDNDVFVQSVEVGTLLQRS